MNIVQRIKSTKPRRSAEAQEAFQVRKGKHNKTARGGRAEWVELEQAE
jgi:hypothetical protein